MKYPYSYIGNIRSFFTLSICLSFFTCSLAQPANVNDSEETSVSIEWDVHNPYYQIMAENVGKLDSFIAYEDLQQLIGTLERVARVEQDEALPQYYLAFSLSTMSFKEDDLDNIDKWCDRSELALYKAEQIGGIDEEEILVIRALIQYGRLRVDFMGRGMEASAQAERYLSKGYKMNPDNPRILAVLGQHYLNIPPQVGGSREKSCQFLSLSKEAFVKEKQSFPEGIFPIVPHWGEFDVNYLVNKYCRSKRTEAKTKTP
ncbi:hypothetical protein [Neolewinella agarilytica]|uniref:Uncharacterized protein n=1 Tax=Neolewinella agarilytica TaxID=478744 RepID=A0A1H9AIG3_9BACT|nr:hypothetical protein [Neolewinella agarilytica]SEP76536.1 hypothetical protein SAMN05444359_102114 [Neolewinella agarilytica]